MKSLETKKVIRKQILYKRDCLTSEQKEAAEIKIFQNIISLKEFQEAQCILLYANKGSEVSTEMLLMESFERKKEVYFPRVLNETEMEFYRIRSRDDLRVGSYQIKEPITTVPYSISRKAFMILPMTAFDNKRNRLGYGKGYYDRYLSKTENIYTCGIAFECQRWEEILPVDRYDYPLATIVTESHIY